MDRKAVGFGRCTVDLTTCCDFLGLAKTKADNRNEYGIMDWGSHGGAYPAATKNDAGNTSLGRCLKSFCRDSEIFFNQL